MSHEHQQLHVVFFPFMAPGHKIPTLDIANLFAARGVKVTIITTPLNAPFFAKAIENSNKVGIPMIRIEVFRFPTAENGLPNGCESLTEAIKYGLVEKFFKAVDMLREQLEQYLEKVRPAFLVADMFFTWTTDSAAKFNVPRVVFQGTCCFTLCDEEIVRLDEPFKNVFSDTEPFIIPSFPHEVKMTRLQTSESSWKDESSELKDRYNRIKESELKSYGVILNTFYELEPEYAEFFTNKLGRKAWKIGPVSLCNGSFEDKAQRGKEVARNECKTLEWLNTKQLNSVIYICTGSLAYFKASQLHEIAMALEASKQYFIWVVKNDEDEKSSKEWLPQGFEQRMEGKCLIIRGWAPQLLILEHEATGAFVTHCGWNSTLEGIFAGVPMVTWPGSAEQFYNEKLVTAILKIGVPVGAKKWTAKPYIDDFIKRDMIEKALREVIHGDEAQERRNRAKKLKEMAQNAVQENGSSYSDLGALIHDLKHYHATA